MFADTVFFVDSFESLLKRRRNLQSLAEDFVSVSVAGDSLSFFLRLGWLDLSLAALAFASIIAEVETDRDRPDEPRATFPIEVILPFVEAALPPTTAVVELEETRLIELVLTTAGDES